MDGRSGGSPCGRCQVSLAPKIVLTKVALDSRVINRFIRTYMSPANNHTHSSRDHTHQGGSSSADVSIPVPPVIQPMRATPLVLTRPATVPSQRSAVKSSKKRKKLLLKQKRSSKSSIVENGAAVVGAESSNVYLNKPISFKSDVPVAHSNSSILNSGHSLSSVYSTPTKSTNDPSIFESPSTYIGPLTTNSLLTSPNVTLGSDFDGITDWFDFEDQIQTATKQLAIEPHESSKHITSTQLMSHPAVPHSTEDVARIPTPAVRVSPDAGNLSMAADTLPKLRRKEKQPRKKLVKMKPAIVLDSFGNPIKRKRGRPRKHPLSLTGQPVVKIEPPDISQPHPLLAEPATKNKKKKHDKAAAQLITQVFGQGWEKRKFPHQTTVEDQGYYTCISGSDSSSRSSHIPVSHSPLDNMLSPDFIRSQPSVLIQDPILLGQEPLANQNQDISVSVLVESGQCDVQAALPNEPSDVELIRQLDALLSDEGAHILDDMIIGETQEVTTYEDEEAILSSESVTGCLVKLQQCGRITGATHLVSKQGVAGSIQTKVKQFKGQKVKRSVTNTKAVTPRHKSTPSMVNSRTKSGRTIKPTPRMMDFSNGTDTLLDDSLPTSPNQGGSNESEEEVLIPKKKEIEPLDDVSEEEASVVSDGAYTATPPVPPRAATQTPHIDSKLKLKLKDLRLSIPRSPVTQRLGSFSFKLPKLSSVASVGNTSCARIVTIESTPPPAPKQGVAFNPPTVMPPSTEASTPNNNNTLNMSLDAILKEMDQAKAAEQIVSSDARVVTVNPADPPIYQRLDSERTVRFTTPDFDGSLTDNDISDLFSPLDVETSLEQVLQGDSLFGPEPADKGPPDTGPLRVVIDTSNDASPVKVREVRFKLEEDGGDGDDDCSTAEEPFCFNLSPSNSFEDDSSVATPPPKGESPDEDAIDLHADDFDMFDSDVKDTPLSSILFKRPPLPKKTDVRIKPPFIKTTPTPPPWRQKQRPHSHPVSPDEGGSSPGYNHPPALMPYKKEQVSQWVAEAQRHTGFFPPTPHRTAHVPGSFDPSGGVLNRNGNSSNERLRFDEPQPRPISPAGKPQGGNKDLFPRSLLGGHCQYFLRGRCDFNNCRFKHTPLNLVPLHILEVALFQGTPVDSVPMEVLYHYGNDPPSCSQLSANWKQFIDLIHGLLYKNFGAVSTAYQYFSFSVQFTLELLKRILELCSLQPPTGHHGNPLALAENIFAGLRKRGRFGRDICYFYLKTLSNFDVPLKLMEGYKVMRSLGEPPNHDIFLLMLRLSKTLGQRVFDLLDDIEKCVPPLTSMEAARCVNRLIDIADSALLLTHIKRLGQWLEHTSLSITSKITGPAFIKLAALFTQEQNWSPLITLYHSCPKHAATLEGSQISEALHTSVTVLGPSDKMADILSMLSDEQLAGISSEVWNRMITDCAEKGKVQRARRFYRVAATHKKQFSVHTSSALLRLLMSQGEHSEAVGVLKQCLETTPFAPPPLSLLTQLCDVMDTPSDLQLVIKTLIVTNTTPPPAVLQSLLNAHSKQKAYKRLAEVVAFSLDYNTVLDKLFYQKVLVELRQWGRDQDAISTVYKALRRVENLETSDEGFSIPSSLDSPPSPPPWPPTGGSISPSVPTALTTKTLLTTSLSTPTSIPAVSGGGVAKAAGSLSLENMMKASTSQDQSSLIKLIEVNGSLGQFGAVASVLVSFPDSQSHYDNQTVGVVWRAINNSSLKTANAFSSLLAALAQSRSHAFSSPPQSALLPSDKWLVSQLGIAILKIYETKEDWQSGFVVLHHLHRYGIHYVKLSEPSAHLPPCSPVPPTPCTVALSAINVCMHMDQVNGALEVLQGCEWIQASNNEELLLRTKLLTEMVEKFLHLRETQKAWKCLLAIDSESIVKNYQHAVINLHNKLLQTLLSSKDVSLALSVYQVMRTNKLQCLPVYFSCLLRSLCSDNQELVAKELCKTAISDSFYCSLSGDNLLQVTLPAGLVRLELHLLLEDHLRKVIQTVDTLQPLLVQFNTDSRSYLEQVFSTDFDPPLTVHFLAKGSSLSISPSSLAIWASQHKLTRPSVSPRPLPVTPMQAHSITELVRTAKPLLKASNKRKVESHDLSHDSASDSSRVCPLPTVPGEQCPVESDVGVGVAGKRPVRLKRKRTLCDTEPLPQDTRPPPTKKPLVDKELKHTACQLFINHLKPYYQTKKFKTPGDYKHLIKTLSLKYFKTLRTQEAPLLEAMDSDIAAIVASLMPRVRVYSSDMVHELGLYTNSDDT